MPATLSHNPAARDQRIVDANRQATLDAQRILTENLKRLLNQSGYWGTLTLTLTIEESEVKKIEEASSRTHKVRR